MHPYYTRPNKPFKLSINGEEISDKMQDIDNIPDLPIWDDIQSKASERAEQMMKDLLIGVDSAYDEDFTVLTTIASTGTNANNEYKEITKETFEELYKDLEPIRKFNDFLNPKPIKLECEFESPIYSEENFPNTYRWALNHIITSHGYQIKTITIKQHKKKRINKKWNKRYGYKYIMIKDKSESMNALINMCCMS